MCTLICDTRERNVLRHSAEFSNIKHEIKQITIGDYAVICPAGRIIAVIERKSLDDFAASLKDGRHSNKQKMIDLRAATGCRVLYIVEGPEFPDQNACYGNIPYKHIESSIFHLIIRDNISVIKTKNTLETAKLLVRFMQSNDTLCRIGEHCLPALPCAVNKEESIIAATTTADHSDGTTAEGLDLLSAKHVKDDIEIIRNLWACFPGIATETADEYAKNWSLAEIICKKIPNDQICSMKLASGRKIGKKAAESLCRVDKLVQTRLLSRVPGISAKSAVVILGTATLSSIITWEAPAVAMIPLGKKKLGITCAERIIKLFSYKNTTATAVCSVETTLL